MDSVKSLISTKTFQLAALQALLGVILVFSQAYPEAGFLLLAKSIVDAVLRMNTSQPVGRIF